MTPNRLALEVWGDLACFTQPALKVERFSYPVITPSAARAVFDAIYYKPKFRWQVTAIEVLAPPRYIALRRNEVKERAPGADTIMQWASGRAEPQPIIADADKDMVGTDQKGRTQRQTMALKDVRYRLHAEARPWAGGASEQAAIEAQFRRRAGAGQCIYQPYLGCREFPAFFEPYDGPIVGNRDLPDMDLGWMLYDVFDLAQQGTPFSPPAISLFHARVTDGVLMVPDYSSPEVHKPGEQVNDD
ncbi:MAG: type I-C CRISPR-associated protein Cas5c [Armatimonadetes bacterium]|nr:type I-C CRISPR-associated protein Cas5c [Armatimonadota bacterium]